MFEPERTCLPSAGELGERPGAVRSAGHRSLVVIERRSDRGVLLFAYFLLDKQEKVRRPAVLYRDVRISRERRMRGSDSGTASTIY
jgi:hypothetical protein